MTYDAKLNDEREKEAKRRGMSLYEYDASRAVDTDLVQSIVGDHYRRTRPSPEEQDRVIREEKARVDRRAALMTDDVVTVVASAGGFPAHCPEFILEAAQRLLSQGLSPGAAAAVLAKSHRNYL